MPPISPVTLTDDRLLLRLPTLDDVPAITRACQDPEVQRWTTVPVPYEDQDARWFIETGIPEGWANGTEATWIVTDQASEELLACVGLRFLPEERAEVGFWVAAWARGRRVATDATRLTCRWGFQVGVARIEWLAHIGNDASRAVARNVGFVEEGVCRSRCVQRGERKDAWLAALLPEDLR